jgi:hypothetical protein
MRHEQIVATLNRLPLGVMSCEGRAWLLMMRGLQHCFLSIAAPELFRRVCAHAEPE